jgi:hypothetical protein
MDKKRLRIDFREWLAQAAAGFMITGSSGTGKSQLMRLIINYLARAGEGLFLLDPSGDLVADVERDLAGMPKSVQDRIVILKPFDVAGGVACPNPLAVSPEPDQMRWKAKLATKVKHMAMILLMAWGETDFNSKPVMFKWVTRFLHLLGLARLPVSAVRFFFDPSHEVYAALSKIAPDFITQMEMEDLAELKPRDREELIASTKNRFLGLLSNPIVETLLSVTDNAIDMRELIRDRKIVLISLETGEGELADTDVEILANIYLMEIAFAVFNTPREERQWTTVLIDELPLFKSSSPLLMQTMPLVRKLLLRWVVSFQGAFVFPKGTEDPLLNLAIGQCGAHFVFGHGNHKDCDFFARQAGAKHFDPYRRKHTETTPVQLQKGREILVTYDEAVNWSEANQEGAAQATGRTETSTFTQNTGTGSQKSEQVTAALAKAVTEARSTREGHSTADAAGTTSTNTSSWSNTTSRGGSRTKKQTIQPIIETQYIEHITFMSAEEQYLELASEISEFPAGRCIIHRRGIETAIVQLPMVQSRLALTPKYAAKKLAELRRRILSLPIFRSVEQIANQMRLFTTRLVRHLESKPQHPTDHLRELEGDGNPDVGI